MSNDFTRADFGAAVAAILTADQREQIARLHARLNDMSFHDGCAAHSEGTTCCVDAITGENQLP